MLPVLSVNNLTKVYGSKKVVNSINLSLFPGQIYGFVGPNGAGKSTTLKMITGLVPPTDGSVRICGFSIEKNFKRAISNIGAVVEMPQLYPYLSGLKNLQLMAKFYGKSATKRINDIVKLVGMENRIKDKFGTYSLGMKQRLGIAQALLNKPKLLILDEPTNGLDPNGIIEIRNILRALAEKEKMSIIISSHNLAELELICDSIGIIHDGKIINQKSMHEIKQLVDENQRVQLLCNYPHYSALLLKEEYKLNNVKIVGNSIILPLKDKDLATVISFLMSKKIKIFGINKMEKSLEELYLEILNSSRPSSNIV